MTDTTKDIVKADPIETLERASKISLQGGGVMLFVAIAAVFANNAANPKWQVSNQLILALLIGAVLLGIAGTIARMYDAKLRVQVSMKLLELKGTTDASQVKGDDSLFEAIDGVLHGEPFVAYLVRQNEPPQQVELRLK